MTIAEAREKCKSLAAKVPRDALLLSVLVVASSLSFLFGYFAGRDAGEGVAAAAAGYSPAAKCSDL